MWMRPMIRCTVIRRGVSSMVEFPKPALYPVRLNVLETFIVHSRRPLVGFAAIEEVEPILGLFLRFGM